MAYARVARVAEATFVEAADGNLVGKRHVADQVGDGHVEDIRSTTSGLLGKDNVSAPSERVAERIAEQDRRPLTPTLSRRERGEALRTSLPYADR